jgi:hypothetical protein
VVDDAIRIWNVDEQQQIAILRKPDEFKQASDEPQSCG